MSKYRIYNNNADCKVNSPKPTSPDTSKNRMNEIKRQAKKIKNKYKYAFEEEDGTMVIEKYLALLENRGSEDCFETMIFNMHSRNYDKIRYRY